MTKKHTHKYYRMLLNEVKVWACALGCNHYMPKHMESLVNGKKSICWECGEEFILTPVLMSVDYPTCEVCSPFARSLSNLESVIESNSK